MEIIQSKKRIFFVIFIFTFAYFSAYIARKSFAVVIPEIVKLTDISKDRLGLSLTALFVCYGIAQIFAGILSDRINSKILVIAALSLSATINLIVPFIYQIIPLMIVIWGINGIAQSCIWPPMIRLSAICFDKKTYEKSSTYIVLGGYLGQIFLYFIAWLIIKYSHFQILFYVAFGMNILMALIFLIATKNVDGNNGNVKRSVENKEERKKTPLLSFLFMGLLIVIAAVGALRDSIESWTPTYIYEAFNIKSENAIIGSIFLPILSVGFIYLSLFIYQKFIKNPIILSLVYFSLGLAFIVLLMTVGRASTILTFILMALIYGISCGTNHNLISYIPIYFKDTGKVSTIASILNATTYAGSAIATYAIALISNDKTNGWNNAMFVWLGLIVLTIVLFIVLIKPWNNKVKQLAS